MALYYLHLCDGQGFLEDKEGEDHADLAAAVRAATQALREAMAADMLKGVLNTGSYMEIEDVQHRHVVTVQFADVVQTGTVCGRNAR